MRQIIKSPLATREPSTQDARKLVDGLFTAIADAAAKGEEIALNGFGKFKVKASLRGDNYDGRLSGDYDGR